MLGDLAKTRPDQTVFAKEKVGVVARRPAASWLLVSSEQKGSEIKKLKRTQIVSSWPARRTSDLLRRSVRAPTSRSIAVALANALHATLRFWYFLGFNEAVVASWIRQEWLRGFEMVTLFGTTRARDPCASDMSPPTTQKCQNVGLCFALLCLASLFCSLLPPIDSQWYSSSVWAIVVS